MSASLKSLPASALLDFLPLARMIDNGVDYGDAVRIRAVAADLGWVEAAEAMARTAHELASGHQRRARDAPSAATAVSALRAAVGCLVVAQAMFNADTPHKRELYAELRATVGALGAVEDNPITELLVPYGGSSMCGWLTRPRGVSRPATVAIVSGMNGWGPAYLGMARALADRGLACYLPELPGQGATRLEFGLTAGPDLPSALSTALAQVVADPDLGDAVGVWGNSFGGLIAALATSVDPRVRACCINGGPSELPPVSTDFIPAFEMTATLLGTTEISAMKAILDAFRFPNTARLTVPVLLMRGGRDRLVPAQMTEVFRGAAGANLSERIWPDGSHTLYEHRLERDAVAADWFAAQLH